MNYNWQDLVALSLVLAAVIYLGWQTWRFIARKKSAGCSSGCASCPTGKSTGQQLVTLDGLSHPAKVSDSTPKRQ